MYKLETIPIHRIEPDPDQPRKLFDEAGLLGLGQNLKIHGQQLPVIAYESLAEDSGVRRLTLLDGERRWRAAQLVGMESLLAIVLDISRQRLNWR